jgi:parvulin-like peptidyl-prolyl isomerase
MKNLVVMSIAIASLFVVAVHADDDVSGNEVLASRGNGIVTHEMFDTRASRIPEQDRQVVLRDRRRLQEVLNNMLLNSQMAADARAAHLDEDPLVQARMQLAAEEELAKAWLQHMSETGSEADYQAMAREFYTANPDRFKTPVTLDLNHILIGTADREDADALALAQDLRTQIVDDPALFEDFVAEFSDDPSAAANKGRFKNVRKGQMEKPFENAAFAMQAGDLSLPVRTSYGYHLIRINKINEPQVQSFDEVEDMLVERLRKRQHDNMQNDYLSSLGVLPVEIPDGALEAMVIRQFGEDVLLEPADAGTGE